MQNNDNSFDKVNDFVKNSMTLRFFLIGFLILILLIPTELIKSLISERESTRTNAIYEVTSKWGNEQTLAGPFLVVPYNDVYVDSYGKAMETVKYAYFLPDLINIDGKLLPELRYRSIYEVVVYSSNVNFSGSFSFPSFNDMNIDPQKILWKDAFVSLGITDMRGIEENINLKWNNETYSFNPGTEGTVIATSGVSTKVNLTKDIPQNTVFNYSFSLNLKGSNRIFFAPLGKETNVKISSAWKTPSFDGAFLPDNRTIDNNGFNASWKVLYLNRNFPQQWKDNAFAVNGSEFGVKLLLPVDEYQKSTRSAKYAIMIIALTFLAFFFIEMLNKKRIHPIQYLLVGLALVIFYVLLISLSEHISFNFAYIVGGLAVISLISMYAAAILRNTKLTAIVSLILVLLYGFVYTILQLEDYALLMGSVGLFFVLALLMFFTRKINWYSAQSNLLETKENDINKE